MLQGIISVASPESNACRWFAPCAQFPTWGNPGPEKDDREGTTEILLEWDIGNIKDCNI